MAAGRSVTLNDLSTLFPASAAPACATLDDIDEDEDADEDHAAAALQQPAAQAPPPRALAAPVAAKPAAGSPIKPKPPLPREVLEKIKEVAPETSVEVMSTKTAVATHNILVAEGRSVLSALLI